MEYDSNVACVDDSADRLRQQHGRGQIGNTPRYHTKGFRF